MPSAPQSRDSFIAACDAVLSGGGLRTVILLNGSPTTVEAGLFAVVGNGNRAPCVLAEQVRGLVGDLFVDGLYDALARRLILSMVRIEERRPEEAEAKLLADAEAAIEQRKAEAERKRAEQGLPPATIGRPKKVTMKTAPDGRREITDPRRKAVPDAAERERARRVKLKAAA